ncbi:4-hydroxythreonine-4-phosphate dehydrogenase PdxA [Erythrobacter sp. Alg231-14]|uniref:4-hydroxythreonine-4-phosphate dehydrogenase PdxA n=1 Tax=Erythrobacter sp. Alg231-14 TaxID=1922225 RepID=UPI000D55F439
MTFPPTTTHQKPLAIALGDPAGIGPEIILDSYRRLKDQSVPFFIMGGAQCLATAEEQAEIACPVVAINDPSEAADAFVDGLPVLKALDAPYTPGAPSDEGAALALHSLAEATRCVIEGKATALVTAPVSKAGLTRVGFEYPGQTEFLAQVCGMAPDDAVMMLAGPTLRTVPLTVHVALSAVPALISIELITHKARIVAAALKRDFGCDRPRIAIAGLNPHSGEGGQFGNEEGRFIEPAIATLRDEGIEAVGPVPGDALFNPRMRKTYDAALCMYHDQALIPIKAIEFDEGVNVTLGLPIVRTSPDHGTAFDIAGSGVADSSAMVAAIKMAAACASARSDGGVHG